MSHGFEARPKDEENFGNWQVEPELPSSEGRGCLKGCLIAAVVLLLLLLVGGWFVSQKWRGWVGTLVETTLEQTLDESTLPEDEKLEIQVQVQRVVEAFEDRRLTQAQIDQLIARIAQSPLSASMIAFTIEKKYFDRSGLSDEEKAAGRMTLRRGVRGLIDGDLTEQDADAVLSHIGTKRPDGNWDFRDNVTDEELREFLSDVKTRADAAGVAETVDEVDPSDEVKRIVDSILNPEAPDMELPAEAPSEDESSG